MSCHGCANSFGFLNREVGCPKCGFSFCKKCLRYKLADASSPKELTVCRPCSLSAKDPNEPPTITKALIKLASLENPAKPPITVYRQPAVEAKFAQLKRGLSEEDKQIADRLENLMKHDSDGTKNRRRSEPIEEIEDRLAKLKDEDPSLRSLARTSAPCLLKSKPETDTDLIAKYSAEAALDSRYQEGFSGAVSDIEARLLKLRGQQEPAPPQESSTGFVPSQNIEEEEEISEEEQVKRIIEKFKAEVELESKNPPAQKNEDSADPVPFDDSDVCSGSEADDVDNLCRICDEKRAVLKCKECDGDLFCKGCFDEFHVELGEVHKPTSLK